jgi:hypothetical protein
MIMDLAAGRDDTLGRGIDRVQELILNRYVLLSSGTSTAHPV